MSDPNEPDDMPFEAEEHATPAPSPSEDPGQALRLSEFGGGPETETRDEASLDAGASATSRPLVEEGQLLSNKWRVGAGAALGVVGTTHQVREPTRGFRRVGKFVGWHGAPSAAAGRARREPDLAPHLVEFEIVSLPQDGCTLLVASSAPTGGALRIGAHGDLDKVKQVAATLRKFHAHEQPIGNLCPAGICYVRGSGGDVPIFPDFGLPLLTAPDDLFTDPIQQGRPNPDELGYFAPEQIQRLIESKGSLPTPESDIYFLGVAVARCVLGDRAPSVASYSEATDLGQRLRSLAPSLPLNPDARRLIAAALDPLPAHRPDIAELAYGIGSMWSEEVEARPRTIAEARTEPAAPADPPELTPRRAKKKRPKARRKRPKARRKRPRAKKIRPRAKRTKRSKGTRQAVAEAGAASKGRSRSGVWLSLGVIVVLLALGVLAWQRGLLTPQDGVDWAVLEQRREKLVSARALLMKKLPSDAADKAKLGLALRAHYAEAWVLWSSALPTLRRTASGDRANMSTQILDRCTALDRRVGALGSIAWPTRNPLYAVRNQTGTLNKRIKAFNWERAARAAVGRGPAPTAVSAVAPIPATLPGSPGVPSQEIVRARLNLVRGAIGAMAETPRKDRSALRLLRSALTSDADLIEARHQIWMITVRRNPMSAENEKLQLRNDALRAARSVRGSGLPYAAERAREVERIRRRVVGQ